MQCARSHATLTVCRVGVSLSVMTMMLGRDHGGWHAMGGQPRFGAAVVLVCCGSGAAWQYVEEANATTDAARRGSALVRALWGANVPVVRTWRTRLPTILLVQGRWEIRPLAEEAASAGDNATVIKLDDAGHVCVARSVLIGYRRDCLWLWLVLCVCVCKCL